MVHWPTTFTLMAAALLSTSMVAPAFLVPLLGPVALPWEAPMEAPQVSGFDALPSVTEPAPASKSFGIFVSGVTPTSPPIYGPNPLSTASAANGRAEDQAVAEDIRVHDNAGKYLATAKAVSDYAAANTVVSKDRYNNSIHWASQARAHATLEYVSIANGTITARAVEAHVLASANMRNASAPYRLDSSASRVLELRIFGALYVVGSGEVKVTVPGVGTLHVNETIVDPVGGTITVYALHLETISGLHIVVGGASATVARNPLGPLGECQTHSKTYALGDKGRVGSTATELEHQVVQDDPVGSAHSHGELNLVPVSGSYTLTTAATAGLHTAYLDAVTGPWGARAFTTAEVTHVNMLNGMVTADLVKAVADATITLAGNNTTVDGNANGGVLVNLRVMGTPLGYTPAPNTIVDVMLGGKSVATLVLNEQTTNETSTTNLTGVPVYTVVQRSNMIRLVVTAHNLGVPVGTQLVVAHAISTAKCGPGPMPPFSFGDPLGLGA